MTREEILDSELSKLTLGDAIEIGKELGKIQTEAASPDDTPRLTEFVLKFKDDIESTDDLVNMTFYISMYVASRLANYWL